MYDFDKKINRKNSNSYKWDSIDYELPMWVADMDFECFPGIIKSIKERLNTPVFGYSITPLEYYDAYISWFKRRHDVEIKKDWIFYSTGVVPTISSTVRKLSNIGDNVLILSPVYNIFYNSIINNNRHVLACNLVYENGNYDIDYKDLENKLSDPKTTLFIFCNPHNPVGKIWKKEELERIGNLCIKYHVTILSDEIHCDIVSPGVKYNSFLLMNDEIKNNLVLAISATKCFGIPGLQSSAVVIPNEDLRKRVNRQLNTDECAEGNVFAYNPIIEAFNHGEVWVDSMNAYVYENKKVFYEMLKDTDLTIIKSDALYLVWVDISKYTKEDVLFRDFLANHTGLYVSDGTEYGINGKGFLRINLATQRDNVIEAAKRLKLGLKLFREKNNEAN